MFFAQYSFPSNIMHIGVVHTSDTIPCIKIGGNVLLFSTYFTSTLSQLPSSPPSILPLPLHRISYPTFLSSPLSPISLIYCVASPAVNLPDDTIPPFRAVSLTL